MVILIIGGFLAVDLKLVDQGDFGGVELQAELEGDAGLQGATHGQSC